MKTKGKKKKYPPKCPIPVNTIVRFTEKDDFNYPFKYHESLLFLGEITNMPGHCILVNRYHQTFWGYHTNNFEIEPEDRS